MPPAARILDPTTHGMPLAPGPGSVNVLIGGLPAWRAMIDQHACPAVSISGADGVGMVMMGSPTVLINNMMACRLGDIVMEIPGLAVDPKTLGNLKAQAAKDPDAALKETAKQFETLFLDMMMKSMRTAAAGNSEFDSEATRTIRAARTHTPRP